MEQMETFVPNDPLPSRHVNALGRFLSTYAQNFELRQISPTAIRAVAGADELAACIAIEGKWRYRESDGDVSHPGGSAGTHKVFACAAANSFSGATDSTNYTFTLQIKTSGTPTIVPGTVDIFREVGEVVWDGSAISRLTQTVGGAPKSSIGQAHIVDTYANRPAAAHALNGVRFFASDKAMEWQCVAGAWVLVNVFAPEVTGLPSSPIDQQECVYVLDAATGAKVHLRYRSAASGSYKWEPVGLSPPLYAEDATLRNVTSTSYADVPTATLSLTLPLAGDYLITVEGNVRSDAANTSTELSYSVGATPASDAWSITSYSFTGSLINGSGSLATRHTGLAASTVIEEQAKVSSGTGQVSRRRLMAQPLRVG